MPRLQYDGLGALANHGSGDLDVRAVAGELIGALSGVDTDLGGEVARCLHHLAGEVDGVALGDGVARIPGSGVLTGNPQHRPNRVVIDAHTAVSAPRISAAARHAGMPFLIDPETYFLQDLDPASDKTAQLPFVRQKVHALADLMNGVH